MKIYLVRHGETLFNLKGLIQGWCDSPLTQKGIQQSLVVGKTLQEIPFTHAYCSTSPRTLDTLKNILQDRDIPYTQLEGLKEMNFGSLEGDKESVVFAKDSGISHQIGFHAYGGDDINDVSKRMYETLEDIAKHNSGSVLVISHGGAIFNFLLEIDKDKILNYINEKGSLPNCSITVLEYDGKFHVETIAKEVICDEDIRN